MIEIRGIRAAVRSAAKAGNVTIRFWHFDTHFEFRLERYINILNDTAAGVYTYNRDSN